MEGSGGSRSSQREYHYFGHFSCPLDPNIGGVKVGLEFNFIFNAIIFWAKFGEKMFDCVRKFRLQNYSILVLQNLHTARALPNKREIF